MSQRFWKVGELAQRTGVTVRTLHHYDEIGLLRPAFRTRSNYRQYSEADVVRLQQIVSLRQVGFSLEEIAEYLAGPGSSPLEVLERHIGKLHERMAAARSLCERLERLAEALRLAEEVSADDFIQAMEMITMFEKYYTEEQLAELDARRQAMGEDQIREVEAEWPRLMEQVQTEMEKGTDPSDERVQALARRWQELIAAFTGGNPGIESSLQNMYAGESEVHGMPTGPMREMGKYIQRSLESMD